jgi:hypothetical protein
VALRPEVTIDPHIQHEGDWMCTPAMYDEKNAWPHWSTGEVAKTFFAMPTSTFYSKIYRGEHIVSGEIEEGPPRKKGDRVGAFTWRLYDIERVAKGMALNGHISLVTLTRCMGILKSVAKQYDFLE